MFFHELCLVLQNRFSLSVHVDTSACCRNLLKMHKGTKFEKLSEVLCYDFLVNIHAAKYKQLSEKIPLADSNCFLTFFKYKKVSKFIITDVIECWGRISESKLYEQKTVKN